MWKRQLVSLQGETLSMAARSTGAVIATTVLGPPPGVCAGSSCDARTAARRGPSQVQFDVKLDDPLDVLAQTRQAGKAIA